MRISDWSSDVCSSDLYQQTFLGVLWAVVQPLAFVTIFTVVFSHMVKIPSCGVHYPAFCLCGMIIWNLFIQGVSSASNSIVSHRELIPKIYFPRIVMQMASVLVGLMDLAITLVLRLGLMIFYG